MVGFFDDAYAVGRWKYVAAGIGIIFSFVAIWLDRRQLELSEARLRPRTITNQQQRSFLKTLEATPKGAVKVNYIGGSTEIRAFALQVYSLLREAGYDVVEEPQGAIVFGAPPVGIEVCSKDPNNPLPLVEPLRMAFGVAGIPAERAASHESEEGVLVVVGAKE